MPSPVKTTYDNVQIIKKIGEGSYGNVYSAINKSTGTTIVVKKIPKSMASKSVVMTEVNILKHLKPYCENYILCYDGFYEDTYYSYITTEFLGEFITLSKLLKTTPEKQAIIVYNLVNGLKEIHKHNVAHCDIKPDNIMVCEADGRIKYIDFGQSCYNFDCNTSSFMGTPVYLPPEHYQSDKHTHNIDKLKKYDIWSLGSTIYNLLIGLTPFSYWIKIEKKPKEYDQLVLFLKIYNYENDQNKVIIDKAEKIWSTIYIEKYGADSQISLSHMLVSNPLLRHF